MDTLTIDYFGRIPNDIIQIILSFIDSLQDLFSLLLVSKRFYNLLKINQGLWKSLCLEFWKHFKYQLTQQEGRNYSIEGQFRMDSKREWKGMDLVFPMLCKWESF